jgi:hypothetical protein
MPIADLIVATQDGAPDQSMSSALHALSVMRGKFAWVIYDAGPLSSTCPYGQTITGRRVHALCYHRALTDILIIQQSIKAAASEISSYSKFEIQGYWLNTFQNPNGSHQTFF